MVGCVIISGHIYVGDMKQTQKVVIFICLYVYVTIAVKKEEAVYFEGSLWQGSTLEAKKQEREMM